MFIDYKSINKNLLKGMDMFKYEMNNVKKHVFKHCFKLD